MPVDDRRRGYQLQETSLITALAEVHLRDSCGKRVTPGTGCTALVDHEVYNDMQAAGLDVKHSSHAQMAIKSRVKGQNTWAAVEQVLCVRSTARGRWLGSSW